MTGTPALGSLTSVRVGGALLPSDVLSAVLAGTLDGLSSSDYHLGGEAPRAAAARVWNHLLGVYRRFRDEVDKRPDTDPAVRVTRERWLTLLLSELGYGRVPATEAGGITHQDKPYPVTHLWGATPIHLLGWNVPLDKRTPGVAGAADRAPHAMVQELLNRDDTYLWAIVSNGRLLRLLRDATTLTGQAYVEFDLETMFDGELFAEFALLYLLAHQSRVEVPTGGQTSDCWLEKWRTSAISQGVRALNLLRDGVQQAIETLGTGVLQHPANAQLRADLDAGRVRLEDLHASLLRTVYRLLFWAVAEDRDALLASTAPQQARERYAEHFSSARLRRLATRRHGSNHDDLWQAVSLVLLALGRTAGEPRLGLDGLGGLFLVRADDVLTVGTGTTDQPTPYRIGNQPLLKAIRALSIVQPKGQPRRHVDFKNLGAEELGSIYESLLELVPRRDPTREIFTLESLAGNDRKTTGSYYTPTDLVELVLDTALDPVLDEAERQPDPEQALLALTVCDPAIGSGHFMVAAARRIAARVATARSDDTDPTPTDVQRAMHDVVSRCIYGVDLNPMAADLAKVSLWLEAMTPGLPLSFLDHHVKVGNALLGTTPKLLHDGIPDTAYVALTGDDRPTVALWKRTNATQRSGQGDLFSDHGLDVSNAALRVVSAEVSQRAASAQNLADVSWAAQRYVAQQDDELARRARRTADAWCVAFLGAKTPDDEPITHTVLEQVSSGSASDRVVESVDAVAHRHRLFHWHLEFPDVFAVPDGGPANTPTGWTGGFSAVLGNPPWEQVKIKEREFFGSRAADIAAITNASQRKFRIDTLKIDEPELFREFQEARKKSEAATHFFCESGRFPLSGKGDVNTYTLFVEWSRRQVSNSGMVGVLAPTGLATDSTTSALFRDILSSGTLSAFYDFENNASLFATVSPGVRFCLISITGSHRKIASAPLSFVLQKTADAVTKSIRLAPEEIILVNPTTGTLPLFATSLDASITLGIYKRLQILQSEDTNLWSIRLRPGLYHMTNDSAHFITDEDAREDRPGEASIALYEGKLISHYDHRANHYSLDGARISAATPEQHRDPQWRARPRYRVLLAEARQRAAIRLGREGWQEPWALCWRNITSSGSQRVMTPTVVPVTSVGNSLQMLLSRAPTTTPLLQALLSSMIVDYLARQKLSGNNLTLGFVKQLAVPSPAQLDASPAWSSQPLARWIEERVLELAYTSWDMQKFAEAALMDSGPPFVWDEDRRRALSAEIDAALMHVYGLTEAEMLHVVASFEALRRAEEKAFGSFATGDLVVAAFRGMAASSSTGAPYRSRLSPPAGHGARHSAERAG